MKLLALSCANCGAALEVPAKVSHLTCEFCGTRLQVQRSGNAVYTEALDHIANATTRIEDNTEVIKLQNELERVDREWMLEREQYMVRGKNGQLSVPSTLGAIAIAGLMGGMALVAAFAASPIFLIVIPFGAVMVMYAVSKANHYQSRHRQYAEKRQRLLSQLEEATHDG